MGDQSSSCGTYQIGKMQKHSGITKSRLDLFLADDNQFTDVSLIPLLYRHKKDGSGVVDLKHFAVPDLKRIKFEEAIMNEFKEAKVGDQYGPSWSTHWFKVRVTFPLEWDGKEVQFRFNSNSEVLIYSLSGIPIQALTGEGGGNQRLEYPLTKNACGGSVMEFYLEMACNGLFGNGPYLIGPPEERVYPLTLAELAVPNNLAWDLYYDFTIIRDMAKKLPDKSSRGERALYVGNKIMNVFDIDGGDGMLQSCLQISKPFLDVKGTKDRHELVAVGHCHIDTAWLWPYNETKRKVARSWSTQIQLMDIYKDFNFVCSQAQQFEWLKQNYPLLFKKVQEKAKTNQFLPIGGTWVEMDCNVPSGEAFCRQFLLGQRFFKAHFGKICKVFWLPDTFGYSAQLPQIIKQAGLEYFFTQKLSWNNINKFPHTTFHWSGLDGTKVLAHMAPAESYNSQCNVDEVLFAQSNNKDKMIIDKGLFLFGNGDGGGGPLPSMLEKLKRLKDLDGLAKVTKGSADTFYDELASHAECDELPVWSGELYLELHRGTYTSHAIIKKYNRKCELLLREVELICTMAKLNKSSPYPTSELAELWKLVCLNQFHDVLPGSSIGMVYKDAIEFYEQVGHKANTILKEKIRILINDNLYEGSGNANGLVVLNSMDWSRHEVVQLTTNYWLNLDKNIVQFSSDQNNIYVLTSYNPPMSLTLYGKNTITTLSDLNLPPSIAQYHKDSSTYTLQNRFLKAEINQTGQVVSLIELKTNRETIPKGEKSNQLKLYEDIPLYWDAWDVEVYHLEKFKLCNGNSVKIVETGPLMSSIQIEYQLTKKSKLTQTIRLSATSESLQFENDLDWHENRKFLKAEFPTVINHPYASYDTQFGVIQRPTHFNTTWELAKFEVCCHKFADLSEPGLGVTIFNDCKYGFAVHDNVMRLSIVRAPKSPDDMCDMGNHQFKYAIYPHSGGLARSKAVKLAHEFNSPLRAYPTTTDASINQSLDGPIHSNRSLAHIHYPDHSHIQSVILETVKISEGSQEEIIMRLYESLGTTSQVELHLDYRIQSVYYSNILEETFDRIPIQNKRIILTFSPFKLVTLKLTYFSNFGS